MQIKTRDDLINHLVWRITHYGKLIVAEQSTQLEIAIAVRSELMMLYTAVTGESQPPDSKKRKR